MYLIKKEEEPKYFNNYKIKNKKIENKNFHYNNEIDIITRLINISEPSELYHYCQFYKQYLQIMNIYRI